MLLYWFQLNVIGCLSLRRCRCLWTCLLCLRQPSHSFTIGNISRKVYRLFCHVRVVSWLLDHDLCIVMISLATFRSLIMHICYTLAWNSSSMTFGLARWRFVQTVANVVVGFCHCRGIKMRHLASYWALYPNDVLAVIRCYRLEICCDIHHLTSHYFWKLWLLYIIFHFLHSPFLSLLRHFWISVFLENLSLLSFFCTPSFCFVDEGVAGDNAHACNLPCDSCDPPPFFGLQQAIWRQALWSAFFWDASCGWLTQNLQCLPWAYVWSCHFRLD